MIIKHGRHVFGEIYEIRKGLWAFISSLCFSDACYCDYRINKPFTCSRCLICVSCSVHVISTYYVRK